MHAKCSAAHRSGCLSRYRHSRGTGTGARLQHEARVTLAHQFGTIKALAQPGCPGLIMCAKFGRAGPCHRGEARAPTLGVAAVIETPCSADGQAHAGKTNAGNTQQPHTERKQANSMASNHCRFVPARQVSAGPRQERARRWFLVWHTALSAPPDTCCAQISHSKQRLCEGALLQTTHTPHLSAAGTTLTDAVQAPRHGSRHPAARKARGCRQASSWRQGEVVARDRMQGVKVGAATTCHAAAHVVN